MNRIRFSIIVCAAALLIGGCKTESNTLSENKSKTGPVVVNNDADQFSWLIGSWNRTNEKEGHETTESWLRDSDTRLSGFSLTVADGKKVWSENIVLEKTGADWHYIVHPSQNQAPTKFKLTTREPNHFIAENPDHDFPQKIEYRYDKSSNTIQASISGSDKKVAFNFEKSKQSNPKK